MQGFAEGGVEELGDAEELSVQVLFLIVMVGLLLLVVVILGVEEIVERFWLGNK